jgi:glucosyl-dolichyl phosphate glucuronosyltransferase
MPWLVDSAARRRASNPGPVVQVETDETKHMRETEFAVVICTRDRVQVLRETIELVLSRLSTFPNSWLVVVDNASTDGTAEYLRALAAKNGRVKVIHEPTKGVYHARLRGIRCARGEFFIFLDDDVVPDQNWPAALILEMAQNPQVGVVGTAVDLIWERDRPAWMTDRLARNVFGGPIPGRSTCRFPLYPYSCSAAFRLCNFLELFAAPERQNVELGWGAESTRAAPVGGEDWDLSELYIKNGLAAITVDHVRVGHRVEGPKVTPSWVLRKFEGDGRLRIRYARLAGYSWLSSRVLILMAAFPVLWALDRLIQSAAVCGRRSLMVQAYSRRARGLWHEFLWGKRGIRFPFHLDSPATARQGAIRRLPA